MDSVAPQKSSVEEIRARFDREVERYANLETGQSATVDATVALELIQQAALRTNPHARSLLDLGCGAGNYALKLLQALPDLEITLIDLSRVMLDRASQRLAGKTKGAIEAVQGDIRELKIGNERFDVIVAAMVLHHLRGEEEWNAVFAKLWSSLKPGGSLWISDFVDHECAGVHALMWDRYGRYLTNCKDETYRDHVFEYVLREDSPRSAPFQIQLLKQVGFQNVDILHKNTCFAVIGAIKNESTPSSSVAEDSFAEQPHIDRH